MLLQGSRSHPDAARQGNPEIRKLRHKYTMMAKQLKNLLNSIEDGDLRDIVSRARQMGDLTRALSAALPAEQAAGVVAANVREDGELVVIAASPAWASRLRYESDRLLEAARSAGIEADTCRVRVSRS